MGAFVGFVRNPGRRRSQVWAWPALAVTLAAAAGILGCHRPSGVATQTQTEASLPQQGLERLPARRDADDVGRFLAGLPGRPGSPFLELEQEAPWQAHRAELDKRWRRIEAGALPALRAFYQEELRPHGVGAGCVFYPFSGPDVLFVTALFPESPTYILVALEPPGSLPRAEQILKRGLETYLAGVRASVESELHRSFFITREMDRQFRGQLTDGLLPAIVHLLVRTGHTIEGYRLVRLDDEGRLVARLPDEAPPAGRPPNRGLELDFRPEQEATVRKLFYFAVNLSDARLKRNAPFLRFLAGLGRLTTYLKATSYMPHHQDFSVLREQVLGLSSAILQDDSGIPYRFFDSEVWEIHLYGHYERPYGSFRWLQQPDLRKAYASQGSKPLGFHLGYGFARIPSNLLLAVRRQAQGAR